MDRFEEAKLRIKEATDLVALIESYLPLKPRGRTLVALCPFHAESTPSFTVFRETQHFRCFGCGKTGDVFSWLMDRDGLTFREAMELLADRAGVVLEGVFKGQKPAVRGPDPYQALSTVAAFFHRALGASVGAPARDYLASRGLAAAAEAWQLGFHPVQGSLMRLARERNLPVEVLEHAGLLRNGREIFAGRLMFPIEDERGRVVGFGGRILPGVPGNEARGDYKPPKYLNSPESPFFLKRRVLYGLGRAKQAGQRRLVVMEGYTDVIACHLAGFTGAVASLGTAFTAEHARTVERYASDGLVLMFDGDRAGQQAAERAMRELVNSRVAVRIALMSDLASDGEAAKDPADVVLQRGDDDEADVASRRQRFGRLLDDAEDALAVWFRLLRRRLDLSQAVHVEAAARECAGMLDLVTEPVRQAALIEGMARHLAVPTPTLERLLQKVHKAERARPQAEQARLEAERPRPLTMDERAEHELLACVLAQPTLLVDLDFEGEDAVDDETIATLLRWAVDGLALGRTAGADLFRYLFARAAELPDLQRVLADAHQRASRMPTPDEVFAGVLEGRRRYRGAATRRRLRLELQRAMAAGDTDAAATIQRQLLEGLRRDRPRGGAAADSVHDAESGTEHPLSDAALSEQDLSDRAAGFGPDAEAEQGARAQEGT
jgi:DNA primase